MKYLSQQNFYIMSENKNTEKSTVIRDAAVK